MRKFTLKTPSVDAFHQMIVDRWMDDHNVRFLPSQARKKAFRAAIANAGDCGRLAFKRGPLLMVSQLNTSLMLSNARGYM
ncbi:hypothetical protein RYA05_04460 [Pseudomonas syringae pv. actinidiae]|nr:hypothetical protein [Pseudomonas syringae pv. actinidiae]